MDEKTLVIVESPAKSNTISKYLGKDYLIGSSMGHVRDLPPTVLGIDLKDNYKPSYIDLADKKQVIRDLKKLAQKAKKIFLASDPDREGEAIAFHLKELLQSENTEIYRIMFHEITPSAVLEAVKHPVPIDINKVNSQQMRRLLDRLAGYKISPVLHRKIGGPLSAGRVQSIALKLIVEREKEIRSFQPEEYWTIEIETEGSSPPPFRSKLEKHNGKTFKIENQEQCTEVVGGLSANEYILDQIKKKSKKKKAPPPLITSSLQQEAFRRFKFPVKRTMKIAQELYEGLSLKDGETTGLITYMRTDSYRISDQAREEARLFIESRFGREFCPARPNVFKSKGKSQDAHECIRPTSPFHHPEDIHKELNPAQFKIYQLIWDRFFASQMTDAVIEETQFEIQNGNYLFISKGEIIRFKGFLEILKADTADTLLPPLKAKEILKLLSLDSRQNFTKPPARYTEATLVKVLEEKSIGRPSTYAKIIETLGKREYVFQEEKKFVPTGLGMQVVDYLEKNFADIMNYGFTAELEKELDLVSEGKLDWVDGIDKFYKNLEKDLAGVKHQKKVEMTIGKKCPKCGGDLIKKYSRKTKGWFVGCSGYPTCTHTEKVNDDGQGSNPEEILEKPCPLCGKPLVKRFSRKTRQYFVGCSGFPNCTHIEKSSEDVGTCPLCQKPLIKRFSRKTRRFFIGCSGYPDCTYIVSQKKDG